jgi:hypothetical protein
MIFIFGVARNVTAAWRFESSHRFKILRLCTKTVCRFDETPSVCRGNGLESFSLRETKLDRISKERSQRPRP